MPRIAFEYRFTVKLPVCAAAAYRWATDFAPDDLRRLHQSGRRQVEHLTEGTILLTDTVRAGGRTVTKQRLVRLRPRARAWTSTHVAGPNRHSQFLYRISPRGAHRSTLEFIGLQVERAPRRLTAAERARRARTVASEDAATWNHIVRAMATELRAAPARARRRRIG